MKCLFKMKSAKTVISLALAFVLAVGVIPASYNGTALASEGIGQGPEVNPGEPVTEPETSPSPEPETDPSPSPSPSTEPVPTATPEAEAGQLSGLSVKNGLIEVMLTGYAEELLNLEYFQLEYSINGGYRQTLYGYGFSRNPDTGVTFDFGKIAGENITVYVNFQGGTYDFFLGSAYVITAEAAPGGAVSGGGVYALGEMVTLTAYPMDGYVFAGWFKDGEFVSDAAEYTFNSERDITLAAVFGYAGTMSETYKTVKVMAGVGGTVTQNMGYNEVAAGSALTVTAEAKAGFAFDGWYAVVNGIYQPLSSDLMAFITPTSDMVVHALFEKSSSFLVTASAGTGGTATGGGYYASGEQVTVQAHANSGYAFDGWYNSDGSKPSGANPWTFTAQNMTLQARFVSTATPVEKYTLTVSAQQGGYIDFGSTTSGQYEADAEITLTAAANAGYEFDGWTVTASVANLGQETIRFTMPAWNVTATAKFKALPAAPKTVKVMAGVGGTVTQNMGYNEVAAGSAVTVTAKAKAGFSFAGWYNVVEGSYQPLSSSSMYTITPSSDMVVHAIFAKSSSLLVTVSAGTGGTATGGGYYATGELVTVQAHANSGYAFDGWYNGGNKVDGNTSWTFTALNITLQARFTSTAPVPDTNAFSVSAGIGGYLAALSTLSGNYEGNTQISVTAAANAGYEFVRWEATGVTLTDETNPTASFAMPDNGVTMTAVFVRLPSSVTSVTVTPGAATLNRGGAQKFTAAVYGDNYPSQDVTWSVIGGSLGTSIDQSGNLTVGANETSETLTVKAVSDIDALMFGTASVTVIQPAAPPEPTPTPPLEPTPTPSPEPTPTPSPEPTQFTIYFNGNGGVSSHSSSLIDAGSVFGQYLPWATRPGYTFLSWNTSPDGSGSVFTGSTPVNADNMTVYAMWSQNWIYTPDETEPYQEPSASQAATPAPATGQPASTIPTINGSMRTNYTTLSDGTISLSISGTVLTNIINGAKDGTVDFNLSGIPDAQSVSMSKDAVRGFSDAKLKLTVMLPAGTLTFGNSALNSISRNITANRVAYTIKDARGDLTQAQSAVVGENTVYGITVSDGTKNITSFNGFIEVRLPYTLGAGESPNSIAVYYVADDGSLEIMKNSRYANGYVIFATKHFSVFMIKSNPVSFNDISSHWAQSVIQQIGAKGLASGYADGSFNPEGTLTRAEFVQFIYNALGMTYINMPSYVLYDDVTSDMWFYEAIGMAKQRGLLDGLEQSSGNFNPNKPITREEMAIILANIGKLYNTNAEKDVSAVKFSDYSQINASYVSAVEYAINVGFLSENGMGNGEFAPKNYVTRAQAATIQTTVLQVLGGID